MVATKMAKKVTRERTLVQVPPDLVAEIDRVVGPRNRSAFLVDLARRELKRLRLLKVFEDEVPIWKDEDHPELAGDPDSWVRQLRMESETRIRQAQLEGDASS